jgi:hypothetical protein
VFGVRQSLMVLVLKSPTSACTGPSPQASTPDALSLLVKVFSGIAVA